MKLTFTECVSLLVLGLASGLCQAAQPFEQLDAVPSGWKYIAPAKDSQPIKLRIGLKQGDAEGFHKAFMDMSTPSHPNYGNHFTSHDEMKRSLLPSEETVESVISWLDAADIESTEVDADWVVIKTSVGRANALLDTEFGWYSSQNSPGRKLRTLSYTVPDEIASHIDLIQPTTRFGGPSAMRSTINVIEDYSPDSIEFKTTTIAAADPCDSVIDPVCLKKDYTVNDYKADPNSGSKVSFASFLEEYAQYKDLTTFENTVYPAIKGQNFSVVTFNNGLNSQNGQPNYEANLDVQYITSLAAPLPVTEYSTGGRGPLVPDLDQPGPDVSNEPYLEFLGAIMKLPQASLPQVLSVSYGEPEQEIPLSYRLRVCDMFAQLGSRGVSVLFSSGDSGPGDACTTNDGKNTSRFTPNFPTACPYVTSVGGSRFVGAREAASFLSGGGFSDTWARPAYQDAAVTTYLGALGTKNQPYYNATGRGYPDVALQSEKYKIVAAGRTLLIGGTSASCPTFGGIVGLLNDARLRNKKPVLGFLNPLLYSNAASFKDITTGGAFGCNGTVPGSKRIPFASWNATKGWDPVTGLGAPQFDKLVNVVLGSRYGGY